MGSDSNVTIYGNQYCVHDQLCCRVADDLSVLWPVVQCNLHVSMDTSIWVRSLQLGISCYLGNKNVEILIM